MAVPAFLRLGDSGVRLDSGLRALDPDPASSTLTPQITGGCTSDPGFCCGRGDCDRNWTQTRASGYSSKERCSLGRGVPGNQGEPTARKT